MPWLWGRRRARTGLRLMMQVSQVLTHDAWSSVSRAMLSIAFTDRILAISGRGIGDAIITTDTKTAFGRGKEVCVQHWHSSLAAGHARR